MNGGGNPLKRNKKIILKGNIETVMRKSSQVKVSVIIPTYNRAGDLATCLELVFKQDFDDYDVIIVDDASTDNTKEFLKEKNFLNKMVYLRNRQRFEVSRTKNRGVMVAKGKYCWFLDSDTKILSGKCLRFLAIWRILEEN